MKRLILVLAIAFIAFALPGNFCFAAGPPAVNSPPASKFKAVQNQDFGHVLLFINVDVLSIKDIVLLPATRHDGSNNQGFSKYFILTQTVSFFKLQSYSTFNNRLLSFTPVIKRYMFYGRSTYT